MVAFSFRLPGCPGNVNSQTWPHGGAVAIISPFWGETFVHESSYILETTNEAREQNNFVFIKIVLSTMMYKCLGKRIAEVQL